MMPSKFPGQWRAILFFCPTQASSCHQISIAVPFGRNARIAATSPGKFFKSLGGFGIQEGLSQPVSLLIDEGSDTEEAANRAGYRFFTDIDDFRAYVRGEILAVEEIPSAAQ